MKFLKIISFSVLLISFSINGFPQESKKEPMNKFMEWCEDLKQRLQLSPLQIEQADHFFQINNKKVSKELIPKEDYARMSDKEKAGVQRAMLEKEYAAVKDVAIKLRGILSERQINDLSAILNEKAMAMEAELKAIMDSLQ